MNEQVMQSQLTISLHLEVVHQGIIYESIKHPNLEHRLDQFFRFADHSQEWADEAAAFWFGVQSQKVIYNLGIPVENCFGALMITSQQIADGLVQNLHFLNFKLIELHNDLKTHKIDSLILEVKAVLKDKPSS